MMTAAALLSLSPAMGAETPAAPTATPLPEWQISESVTPLTGAKSVVALLPSTNSLINMIGQPDRASLVLRCQEGVLAAYVSWPQVLVVSATSFSGTLQTMVLWKRDQGKIDANFWDRSDEGTAAGKFTTGGASKLIASLVPARQLVTRFTGTVQQDAIFDLGDIAATANRVGAACGVSWSMPK